MILFKCCSEILHDNWALVFFFPKYLNPIHDYVSLHAGLFYCMVMPRTFLVNWTGSSGSTTCSLSHVMNTGSATFLKFATKNLHLLAGFYDHRSSQMGKKWSFTAVSWSFTKVCMCVATHIKRDANIIPVVANETCNIIAMQILYVQDSSNFHYSMPGAHIQAS